MTSRVSHKKRPWIGVGSPTAERRARKLLDKRGQQLKWIQREDMAEHDLIVPTKCRSRSFVFSPSKEFVGNVRNMRRVFFGTVHVAFDASFQNTQQRREILGIIRKHMGKGNKYMPWLDFVQVSDMDLTNKGVQEMLEDREQQPTKYRDLLVVIGMSSNAALHAKFDRVSLEGMSVTLIGKRRSIMTLNAQNWTNIPHFKSQEHYRVYVCTHEMFHAVGFYHHIHQNAYTGHKHTHVRVLSQQTRPVFQNVGTLMSPQVWTK